MKSKPVRWPIGSGPDADLAIGGDGDGQRVGPARADVADEHGGAAIDEALGQRGVKRVGQARFDVAGALGPLCRLGKPVGAVGDIGPAAHAREAVGERLDIARDIVEPADFGGEPVVADTWPPSAIELKMRRTMRAWCIGPTLRKSGRPHAAHSRRATTPLRSATAGSSASAFSTARSIARRGGAKQRIVAARFEAADQRGDVGEVEVGRAPVEVIERAEAMLLDRVDLFVGEGRAIVAAQPEGAEGAVALVAPGAAGDLRHFGDGQAAFAAAVELVEAGEGDVGDVHVEAHADRVGGDEIIDLAAHEHVDLRITGGGRERTHHHRCTAFEAAQHFGERIDLLGREGDDRRARGKPRQLDRTAVAQGRKARAADDLGLGNELADEGLEARRAEDQRFLAAAGAEHAVGEDVAAFGIGAELRFVDRAEGEVLGAVGPARLGRG